MSGPAGGSWGRLEGLARSYLRRRYGILFYSLLFTLGLVPLLTALGLQAGLFQPLLAVNLLAAVASIEDRRDRRVLLGILAAGFVLRLGASSFQPTLLLPASFAIWTVVALLTAVTDLRFALRATRVDSEHVYSALSAYLLAGIFFGVAFWILEHTWPGSLVSTGEALTGEFSLHNGMYFSFVTLATLGYGDIVPRSDVARSLAIIEAVAGQLYLAVLVARLVSIYVATPRATSDKS
ncbi:MAG: potassium channel family protein [Candidatus Acidiferrales bacterium]